MQYPADIPLHLSPSVVYVQVTWPIVILGNSSKRLNCQVWVTQQTHGFTAYVTVDNGFTGIREKRVMDDSTSALANVSALAYNRNLPSKCLCKSRLRDTAVMSFCFSRV